MQEEIRVYVEFVLDMQAEFTAEQQKNQIHTRLVDFLAEDSEAVEFKILRFQSEHDTHSAGMRDAADRAIRLGDRVFWNRGIHEVKKISEKRIAIDTGRRRLSVIDPKHCLVVI